MNSIDSSNNGPNLGPHLFTFVVIADTHLNQAEADSASPYVSTKLANARARYVIEQINRLAPEFVIHLGDLTNPVPSLPTYQAAVKNFHDLFDNLNSPLHLIPGNHDVGDKPVIWMPAGTVRTDYIARYEEHFGPHFYSFDFNDCHFVMINAPIINSGLDVEETQRTWLEQDLQQNVDKRIFFCTHYPLYTTDPNEPTSYDNIDEPGRSWLLGLLETYPPEALFASHVHNFFYNQHGQTECYVLPALSFVRHDYSELFKIEPGPENGRNDAAKLGYFVVKVYQNGHVAHPVRTYGTTLKPGQQPEPNENRLIPRHSKENRLAPLGVNLRHPWAEVTHITPTGGADEFERKLARNDYPLMALWETGIRKLRVPLQDLAHPNTRRRMEAMQRLGHEFTVYTYGVPQGEQQEALLNHHKLVAAWEVVTHWERVDDTLAAIKKIKQAAPLTVLLSKLRTKEDVKREGGHYYHNIIHGFLLAEQNLIEELLNRAEAKNLLDGFVFQLPRRDSPWANLPLIGRLARSMGVKASAFLRMVSENPAEDFIDDLANANRIAQATVAALAVKEVDTFVDTFADIDRGYFVRTGLVDRRYNPRLAGRVVRHLYSALDAENKEMALGQSRSLAGGQAFSLRCPPETAVLILPEPELTVAELPLDSAPLTRAGAGRWVNLETGLITSLNWQQVDPPGGSGLQLATPTVCRAPSLFIFGE